jgi:hypothetical protein
MTDNSPQPVTKRDIPYEDMTPFERLKEFTRRLVAVPKSEIIEPPKPPKRGGKA